MVLLASVKVRIQLFVNSGLCDKLMSCILSINDKQSKLKTLVLFWRFIASSSSLIY